MPLESVRHAISAIRSEIFDFRFYYPLEIVPEAGSRNSLEYYLYSDKLAWDAMRLDSNGIPGTWYRQTGTQYWPAYVAWYGLVNLGHYLRRKDRSCLEIFRKQIDWLEANAVVRSDGAVVWQMNFDYFVGGLRLASPWISAHAQGLAISALVRGWRVFDRPRLLELLRGSVRIFSLTVAEQGIRIAFNDEPLYTEVPGGPAPGILDGFMISLLGLHDLLVETEDREVKRLFDEGIAGLKKALPYWNYRDKWSWYSRHAYLSPPAYHCSHHLLLQTLSRLTGEPTFARYAALWDPMRLSWWDRSEIYVTYLHTKNRCRLKHRTWNQSATA